MSHRLTHPTQGESTGSCSGGPIATLGVTQFGQSGSLDSVYEQHRIDAETIVGASLDLLAS